MDHLMNSAIALVVLIAFSSDMQSTQGAELRIRRDDKDDIKVTTIKEPPYLTVKASAKGNDRYEGYIPELLEKIARKAGLTYQMHLVRDGRYGTKLSNGSWNGMIGELIRKEADLAAAPITISDERKKVVTFTEPIMEFTTTILIKRPAEGEKFPVDTVEELADQTDIKYGIIKDGMTQAFFKKSTKPTYQKMWQYMRSNPSNLKTKMSDGIDLVRSSKGKYAFIIESVTADYWINQYPCELQKLDDLDNKYGYGLATAKNSALHRKVNEAIVALRDSGDLQKLKEKWWKSDKTCESNASKATYTSSFCLIAFVLAFNSLVRLA